MSARRRAAMIAVASVAFALALLVPAHPSGAAPAGAAQAPDFPPGFLWGTAISGFQTEAGGTPANADRNSDWWVWSHDRDEIAAGHLSGDLVERGPGHWKRWRQDLRLARQRLGANAFRFSIEWSRLFPRPTGAASTPMQLDRLVNERAARHYEAELRAMRRLGLKPVVTLNHFTLPSWLHDPIATRAAFAGRAPDDPLPKLERGGWLDPTTVREFGEFAGWAARRYGRLVDIWVTINEPMVVAASGYANVPGAFAAWFPPGVLSFRGAVLAVRRMAKANALAYDAVHRHDRRARVGPVHNMVAFTPANPASENDQTGTRNAEYIFNRIFLNAVVRGIDDRDVDGHIEDGERRRDLGGRADFIGLNYYFRSRLTGLGGPVSTAVPLFDFLPTNVYAHPQNPSAPPCPTECTEFGWEIFPAGLRRSLEIAGRYELPVYVTESGLADSNDDQRAAYLVDHLRALRAAMRTRQADVRGYLAWSLVDNFEWAAGYYPRFGFFSYNPDTLERSERPSASLFRRIARTGRLPG